MLRWVFVLVCGRAQPTAPWSSAGLLSAQEGKVTFGALVGIVTLLAALGHTGGEKSVSGKIYSVRKQNDMRSEVSREQSTSQLLAAVHN